MKKLLTICSLLFIFSCSISFGQVNFVINGTIDSEDDNGCAPHFVNCSDSSINAISWYWLATGPQNYTSSSQVPNPVFVFTEPGVYTISLQINGNTSETYSQEVVVFEPPTADFIADTLSGFAPLEVCFEDISTPGDTVITSYAWNLGVQQIQHGDLLCVTYSEVEDYTIQFVVTDANGCNGIIEKPDYISVLCSSGYTFQALGETASDCQHLNVDFEIIPPPESDVRELIWSFELSNETELDTNYHSIVTPVESSNVYSNIYGTSGLDGNGFYDVQLELIKFTSSCNELIYLDDYIFIGGQRGYFSVLEQSNEVPAEVVFLIESERGEELIIDFDDGTDTSIIVTGSDTISHIYMDTGQFSPKLILTSNECSEISLLDVLNQEFVLDVNRLGTLTSTLEEELINDFEFYPNPTSNTLKIANPTNFNISNIEILSFNGQVIKALQYKNEINLEEYPTGMYILKIYAGNETDSIIFNKIITKQ